MSTVRVVGHEIPVSILQTHLVRHFSPNKKEEPTKVESYHDDRVEDPSSHDTLKHLPCLHIDNPYFQASVHLKYCDILMQEHDDNLMVQQQDGILLIFHHANTSMDTLTEMHNRILSPNLSHVSSQQEDSLRLCISTSSQPIPSSKENDEIYSQRVLWCLDRGYEYIEVDLSEEGLKVKPEVREKDGFDRVVEAIESTVWKSAVMKSRSGTSSTSRWITNSGMETSADTSNTVFKEENEGTTNNSSPREWGGDEEFSGITKLETQQEIKEGALLMDQFEQLLKEAKNIRDASKSGVLSDQERKDRAGNAAQMLMGLLNEMGFDDDDEDEDGSSNSDGE